MWQLAQIRFMLPRNIKCGSIRNDRARHLCQRAVPGDRLAAAGHDATPTRRSYGTAEEWTLVIEAASGRSHSFWAAQAQLETGVKPGTSPDSRGCSSATVSMTSEANAKYFGETLPTLARNAWVAPTANAA